MADNQENDAAEDLTDKDDLYMEPKPKSKVIRVLTVLAYILSVSMAAILLSVYYVFMWDGQPTLARRTEPRVQHRVGLVGYDYAEQYHQDKENFTPTAYINEELPLKQLSVDLRESEVGTDDPNTIDEIVGTIINEVAAENETFNKSSNENILDAPLEHPTEFYDVIPTSTGTPTEDNLIDMKEELEDSANVNSIRNNVFYKKYLYKMLRMA